jgi:hypothetical protein
MIKPRISETDYGITGEFNTQSYDLMMRRMMAGKGYNFISSKI